MGNTASTGSRPFPLGQIVATPNVINQITNEDLIAGLERHSRCDWGDVCKDDHHLNEEALTEGYRLFSVYHSKDSKKFWIITEADRSVTTLLMPRTIEKRFTKSQTPNSGLLTFILLKVRIRIFPRTWTASQDEEPIKTSLAFLGWQHVL